ncbi:hypothetical protein Acsp01_66460 [Actinoplanes sp. NBRC 101535]|nr:hypothetical protein Acsp01_66460 [Actinoplanes sp. NBRC 101535]
MLTVRTEVVECGERPDPAVLPRPGGVVTERIGERPVPAVGAAGTGPGVESGLRDHFAAVRSYTVALPTVVAV